MTKEHKRELDHQLHSLTNRTPIYWVLLTAYAIPPLLLLAVITTPLFDGVLPQITGPVNTPTPPNWVALMLSLIISVPFLIFMPLKKLAHTLSTVIHELGHAFGAIISGQGIPTSIKLNNTTNSNKKGYHGLTTILWRGGHGWQKFSTFLGYPAPITYAILLAALTIYGNPTLIAITLTLTVLTLLILIRNLWGLLITITLATITATIYIILPDYTTLPAETTTLLITTLLLIWGITSLTKATLSTLQGNRGGDLTEFAPPTAGAGGTFTRYIATYYIYFITLTITTETLIT